MFIYEQIRHTERSEVSQTEQAEPMKLRAVWLRD